MTHVVTSHEPQATSHDLLQDVRALLPFLACPWDRSELEGDASSLRCVSGGHTFAVEQGVPVLLDTSPGKSRERGTSLFEETPKYFERLHEKRVNEWKKFPFLAEEIAGPGWLLDVGSGSGTWAVANACRGMPSIGVEISTAGAVYGAKLARELGVKNCFFVAGDATQLPFRPGVFHWVTNYTAIEHIHDPEKCVAEMARVLHSDGRMLVNTINNFSLRWEKGREALTQFLRHSAKYFSTLLGASRDPSAAFRDPATVTYESWSSGEDVDLYEAVSYDLLSICRRHVEPSAYYTFGYPADGREISFGPRLEAVARPLPFRKRCLYSLLRALNHVPVARHMGRTITVVGRRRTA